MSSGIDYSKIKRLTPSEHFDQRWEKLTNFDDIRQQEILEIIQYSIIYLIISLPIGAIIDLIFPNFNSEMSSFQLFIEILVQLLLDVIIIFYLLKIVKLVPFLFYYKDSNYVAHLTSSYSGGIIISIAFISVQVQLGLKIRELGIRIERSLTPI